MDTITPEMRSKVMSAIHSRDTLPEMRVRKMLWANGYRFRVCDRRIGPSGHRGPQVPHAHRGARMLLAPARLGVERAKARADLGLSDGDASEVQLRVLGRQVPPQRLPRRGARKGVGCGWLEPHRRVGVRPQDGEGTREDLRLHPPPPRKMGQVARRKDDVRVACIGAAHPPRNVA